MRLHSQLDRTVGADLDCTQCLCTRIHEGKKGLFSVVCCHSKECTNTKPYHSPADEQQTCSSREQLGQKT